MRFRLVEILKHFPVLLILTISACSIGAGELETPIFTPAQESSSSDNSNQGNDYFPQKTAYPYPPIIFQYTPSPNPAISYPYPEQLHPTQSPTPTQIPPSEITPDPTLPPFPTLLPTIDPVIVDEYLKNTLTVNQVSGTGGDAILQINGGEYGFRRAHYCDEGPYKWLGDEHLLLLPIIGEEEGMGASWTRPVAINLFTTRIWFLPSDNWVFGCDLPRWSQSLEQLFVYYNGQVQVFSPDGEFIRDYLGEPPINLSPSGEKGLFGSMWADLLTGKQIDFNWEQHYWFFRPAWSTDETRIYHCCHNYGDTTIGYGTYFVIEGLETVGRGLSPDFSGSKTSWMLEDTRVMVDGTILIDIKSNSFVHLIDPESQSYQNVLSLAGLSETCPDGVPTASPDGLHIWVSCSEGSYLVYLDDYIALPFYDVVDVISWSPTGRYALLALEWDWFRQQGRAALLDIISGTRLPFPDQNISTPTWNPGKDTLAYFLEQTSSLQIIELPSRNSYSYKLDQPVKEIAWHPNEFSVGILSEDGGLWLITRSSVTWIEPITFSEPKVHSLRWSETGKNIAFVSGSDIFVINAPANYP
jgi:hypothetical protein